MAASKAPAWAIPDPPRSMKKRRGKAKAKPKRKGASVDLRDTRGDHEY